MEKLNSIIFIIAVQWSELESLPDRFMFDTLAQQYS